MYLSTGVDELRGLASHLLQSDRWGTSIGTVLRIYSEQVRHKRRTAAEKRAATAEAERDAGRGHLAECHKQMDEMLDALSDSIAERYAATARAEAAEKRAEALSAEVARLRTDALLLAGLANHRAVYEMDGHDAEALDVAAERADEAADGVVIDVIRRALWGEAASEQS